MAMIDQIKSVAIYTRHDFYLVKLLLETDRNYCDRCPEKRLRLSEQHGMT